MNNIMKKFITMGLSIGIAFTATYMSYSWFEDSTSQKHIINISYCTYKTKAEIDDYYWDNNELELKIPTEIMDKKPTDVAINSASGEFKWLISWIPPSIVIHQNNHIDIRYGGSIDRDNISDQLPTDDNVKITLKYENGKSETYLVELTRAGNSKELHAYWHLQAHTLDIITDELDNSIDNSDENKQPVNPEKPKPGVPEGEGPVDLEKPKPGVPEGEGPVDPEKPKPEAPEGEEPVDPEKPKPEVPEGEGPVDSENPNIELPKGEESVDIQ